MVLYHEHFAWALHIWRLEINIICPPQYDIRRLDYKICIDLIRLLDIWSSVTVNFSNFSNFSGNEVFFPMLFNQLKNGFLWNSNFWKIIFYAFQILKRKFLCFSPTWKSYFMVFSLHFRVLNLYFLGFFDSISIINRETKMTSPHESL